uniref:Uncharacterized protein n=1 Tax=Hyaloperonospora arabidopsidis (strain Emoy2) TaxID=559515 RepID=M4B1D7_HYAAE
MHCEFISGLEVTYSNASPHMYLQYKLSSPTPKTAYSKSDSDAESSRAITQLFIGNEQEGERIKLDKSIDRTNGRFLWFQVTQFKSPTSPSAQNKQQLMLLKEICVEGFEAFNELLVSAEDGCILASEDFSDSKWSNMNQNVGDWIDVKDLSSSKWSVTHIMHQNASKICVHIPTWRKGCDEFMSRSTCGNRFDKLGKHTNVYMSPAYPFLRKQESLWDANMKDLQLAR